MGKFISSMCGIMPYNNTLNQRIYSAQQYKVSNKPGSQHD